MPSLPKGEGQGQVAQRALARRRRRLPDAPAAGHRHGHQPVSRTGLRTSNRPPPRRTATRLIPSAPPHNAGLGLQGRLQRAPDAALRPRPTQNAAPNATEILHAPPLSRLSSVADHRTEMRHTNTRRPPGRWGRREMVPPLVTASPPSHPERETARAGTRRHGVASRRQRDPRIGRSLPKLVRKRTRPQPGLSAPTQRRHIQPSAGAHCRSRLCTTSVEWDQAHFDKLK